MLAAGHVNVSYLLLLLLPSVIAVVLVALTWRARVRSQRAAEDRQRRRAAKSGGSATKPHGTSRSGSGSRAKRRPR